MLLFRATPLSFNHEKIDQLPFGGRRRELERERVKGVQVEEWMVLFLKESRGKYESEMTLEKWRVWRRSLKVRL
jgi:hypothetical protein